VKLVATGKHCRPYRQCRPHILQWRQLSKKLQYRVEHAVRLAKKVWNPDAVARLAKKGHRVIVDQDAPFERISVSNGVQVLEELHAAIWHCDRPAMLAIKPALENPGMGVKVLQKRLGVLTLARRESKQVKLRGASLEEGIQSWPLEDGAPIPLAHLEPESLDLPGSLHGLRPGLPLPATTGGEEIAAKLGAVYQALVQVQHNNELPNSLATESWAKPKGTRRR
jgi:hypothetical protein